LFAAIWDAQHWEASQPEQPGLLRPLSTHSPRNHQWTLQRSCNLVFAFLLHGTLFAFAGIGVYTVIRNILHIMVNMFCRLQNPVQPKKNPGPRRISVYCDQLEEELKLARERCERQDAELRQRRPAAEVPTRLPAMIGEDEDGSDSGNEGRQENLQEEAREPPAMSASASSKGREFWVSMMGERFHTKPTCRGLRNATSRVRVVTPCLICCNEKLET
jgi:hypothetical protein